MVSNSNEATSAADNSVATRYGGAQKSRLSKNARRIIAVVALVAAVAVTFWFALGGNTNMLAFKSSGYSIESDTEAWVEFELTKEPEATVECAVRILTDTAAVAGYATAVIGPEEDLDQAGKELTEYYTVDLRTDQRGSSGEVETCWYVEEGEAPGISNFRDY